MYRSGMKRRRPRSDDFTLGWICALDIELTAAVATLDEEHESGDDTAQYKLGRSGIHNVVISCLPTGQIGTAHAAALATEMRCNFPSLHTLLMVGIAGGVPSLENDIRLGDVVISVPQGAYGGVVQYDFGKRLLDGKLRRTRSLNTPPMALLTAVNNLRSSIQMSKSKIPQYLAPIMTIPGFHRDEAGPDLLFHSSYHHPEGDQCDECSRERIVKRHPRDDDQAVIHYGTAAGGGYYNVVRLLLGTRKVNVDAKDNNGRSALAYAVHGGHQDVIKLLLDEVDIDLNIQEGDLWTPPTWTPLMVAAEWGEEAVVKLILETGKADVDVMDGKGRTVLDWAMKEGRGAIVKILQDYQTVQFSKSC